MVIENNETDVSTVRLVYVYVSCFMGKGECLSNDTVFAQTTEALANAFGPGQIKKK